MTKRGRGRPAREDKPMRLELKLSKAAKHKLYTLACRNGTSMRMVADHLIMAAAEDMKFTLGAEAKP